MQLNLVRCQMMLGQTALSGDVPTATWWFKEFDA